MDWFLANLSNIFLGKTAKIGEFNFFGGIVIWRFGYTVKQQRKKKERKFAASTSADYTTLTAPPFDESADL